MNNRKQLLSELDELCEKVDSLVGQANTYRDEAERLESEARCKRDLYSDTYGKIRKTNAEIDLLVDRIRGRKVEP